MTLLILSHPFLYETECAVRLFFPGEKIAVAVEGDPEAPDTIATRAVMGADGGWSLWARVNLDGYTGEQDCILPPGSPDQDAEWALARLLFELLGAHTGIRPPWGILTGVRPVRLTRAMQAWGLSDSEVRRTLADKCLVLPQKIDLALDIAAREKRLLEQCDPAGFSLYISIPFCPTRCLYCSFVSQDVRGAAKLVPDYVRLLCEELRHTGALAAKLGLKLQTIYMGGGTPTTLSADQLEEIMTAVGESFDVSHLLEYTVEAGRPDTITPAKLSTLLRCGADRVSINPQTMNDDILRHIGRGHTAAQVREGFAMAREAGFRCINMDVIAGLPGETSDGFAATLEQVLAMAPENITVHSLTVKRSSRLRRTDGAFDAGPLDVGALLERGNASLQTAGYRPYYLYRQKGTVQNLENTGYARPGHEGLYNVLIMEEVQTILAVGAGAVTKLYRPGERLGRVFNFKFPFEYNARFGEILARKSDIENFFKE